MDIQRLLFGEENSGFLLEVLVRTVLMFVVILLSLRLLGKRSVAQLSVFELGVIIGLGSAAGDPMFYKDVGLLPSILAFVVIIALYRLITFLINNSERIEKALEGEASYLVEEGRITLENFEDEPIAHEELFMQLRHEKVTHLGQVKHAILETNGNVSVIFYRDEDVRWGLPVLPHLCATRSKHMMTDAVYACSYCGQTLHNNTSPGEANCIQCKRDEWVAAIQETRVT
jgi:uncharacterized membrane protein YcaP (DUF421 family)